MPYLLCLARLLYGFGVDLSRSFLRNRIICGIFFHAACMPFLRIPLLRASIPFLYLFLLAFTSVFRFVLCLLHSDLDDAAGPETLCSQAHEFLRILQRGDAAGSLNLNLGRAVFPKELHIVKCGTALGESG